MYKNILIFFYHFTINNIDKVSFVLFFAIDDLKEKYRRSYIGILWILLSFLMLILIKYFIFFNNIEEQKYSFISHLVIGLCIFELFSKAVSGASTLFMSYRSWILSSNISYFYYLMILFFKINIEFLIIFIPSLFFLFLFQEIKFFNFFNFCIGWLLNMTMIFSISLLISPITPRYRDLIPLFSSIMRMIFFASPILWIPTSGSINEIIATYNPLTHFMNIIRIPIMENTFSKTSFLICIYLNVFTLLLGLFVFKKFKKNIAYDV